MQHNDITNLDNKKLWEEVSSSTKLFLTSTLLSIMKDGVFFFDKDFKVYFANPVFSAITALDCVKETPSLYEIYPDPANRQALDNAKAALEAVGYWKGELTRQTSSNKTVIEELTMSNCIKAACSDENCPSYVGVARDISNEREALERLAWAMNHDELTGLPNRSLFCDAVDAIIKRSDVSLTCLVLVSADLDNFKRYNTDYGHETGDRLLTNIAKRILSTVRVGDIVARTAGDEFSVLMHVRQLKEADEAAKRVKSSFDKDIELDGKLYQIKASLGVACWPKDGNSASELLTATDVALQTSKDSGKNTILHYTEKLHRARKGKSNFEADLRKALDSGLIHVNYQPVIDIAKGSLESVEALARWNDPVRGPVAPDKFIPLAEETDLIIKLGETVLRSACQQCKAWGKDRTERLKVAVNVSTVQMNNPDFPVVIADILASTELPPDKLIIEITESVLLKNAEKAVKHLSQLKALGVILSIDDFGTGYSSLSYMKNLPIDIIKIDREFIKDIEHSSAGYEIVSGIISLAHRMGLKVVAEGVENSGQYYLLKHLNCNFAQGFLFSMALPPIELENRYLARNMASGSSSFLLI
ncbi:hypothetical protein MASR2M29_06320 [Spirochaetota bacterium]